VAERRDAEADAATGQVVDPAYEDGAEDDRDPDESPGPEDIGAVDHERTSVED
jgi:hypothetical protein